MISAFCALYDKKGNRRYLVVVCVDFEVIKNNVEGHQKSGVSDAGILLYSLRNQVATNFIWFYINWIFARAEYLGAKKFSPNRISVRVIALPVYYILFYAVYISLTIPGRGYTEKGIADVGSLTRLNSSDVDPKGEGAVITCISSHFSNNMPLNIIFLYPYIPPEHWKINCIGPKHHGFEYILHMSKVVFSCTKRGRLQSSWTNMRVARCRR